MENVGFTCWPVEYCPVEDWRLQSGRLEFPWWRVEDYLVGWRLVVEGGILPQRLDVTWWKVGDYIVRGWRLAGGRLENNWWKVVDHLSDGWGSHGHRLGVCYWKLMRLMTDLRHSFIKGDCKQNYISLASLDSSGLTNKRNVQKKTSQLVFLFGVDTPWEGRGAVNGMGWCGGACNVSGYYNQNNR